MKFEKWNVIAVYGYEFEKIPEVRVCLMVVLSLNLLWMLRKACGNGRGGLRQKQEDGKLQGRRTEEFITSGAER